MSISKRIADPNSSANEIRLHQPSHAHESSGLQPKAADLPDLSGRHLYDYLVIFNTPEHSRVKTRSVLVRNGTAIKVDRAVPCPPIGRTHPMASSMLK